MLTNDDIKKLTDVFATKEELLGLFATREDIRQLNEKISALTEIVQGLAVNVDKFVGITADLKQEYTMINAQTDRHEKWIQQIAGKLGMKLEH